MREITSEAENKVFGSYLQGLGLAWDIRTIYAKVLTLSKQTVQVSFFYAEKGTFMKKA